MDMDLIVALAFLGGVLVGGLCAFAGVWAGSRKR